MSILKSRWLAYGREKILHKLKESRAKGERIVEYSWVLLNLNLSHGVILDVGSVGTLLPVEFESLGFKTYAIDILPYEFYHPNLNIMQGSIVKTDFPDNFFDRVIAVSTIEHIGLGRYGKEDILYKGGDKEAIGEIYRILKEDGKLLITVPFGIKAVTPKHRVYDIHSLIELINIFNIEILNFFKRGEEGYWSPSSLENVENVNSTKRSVAIACARCGKN